MKNQLLKYFYKVFGNSSKQQLRVLIFHDIEKKDFKKFEKFIQYALDNFNLISPKEFKLFLDGKKNLFKEKKNILLTFDDGYKSQKIVAEKFLNPKNIKALFFPVSDFINLKNKNEAHIFIRHNFFKKEYKLHLDSEIDNMTIEDIIYLNKTGHTIGAHTKTHKQLTKIKNNEKLMSELFDCKKDLEIIPGISNIDDFAYTFGDFESINKNLIENIQKEYKYIYSGLRGNNLHIKSKIIRRDAINLNEPLEVISSYLNGYVDFLYQGKIKFLEKEKDK